MAALKRDTLTRYLELEEQRKALARQARDLGKEAASLEAELEEFVRAEGGKAKTCCKFGYILRLKAKPGSVAWKQEFVRVQGGEAAEALIAAAEPLEQLEIEPVA